MKQKMKQLMGILLSLVMVLGMFHGMSLTATATSDPYSMIGAYFLMPGRGASTTMNFPGASTGNPVYVSISSKPITVTSESVSISHSTAGSYDTVSFNGTQYYRGDWNVGAGQFITSGSGTVDDPYVFAQLVTVSFDSKGGSAVDIQCMITKAEDGKTASASGKAERPTDPTRDDFVFGGWYSDNDLNTLFDFNTTVTSNTTIYAKWRQHGHKFTYTAAGATITGTCLHDDDLDCPLASNDYKATLTIAAPTSLSYDGTAKAAVITDANSIKGDATIQYQTKSSAGTYGTATTTAPIDAGDYKASITVGGATASVEYTIAKVDPAVPSGLTAIYGQTLADVTLPYGWTWDAGTSTSVGNVGSNTFYVSFAESDNYNASSNVSVTVTVNKATPVISAENKTVKVGKTVSLNATVSPEVGVTWGYTSNEPGIATVDENGVVTGVAEGSTTITISATATDSNNCNNAENKTVNIKVLNKNPQTITASDVTAAYGDMGKKVTATVTGTDNKVGAISYAVKEGSGDYIDVDSSTGALTIKKAGTATVIVTAAETTDGGADNSGYAKETKEVTVTINKATVTVAAKDQMIYVGDTVPDLSNPVKGTHYTVTGLVGEDVLGGTLVLAYAKNPDNTKSGTYAIEVSGASVPDTEKYNPEITYQTGTLTISTKSGSGSYGGNTGEQTTPTPESYTIPVENNSAVNVGANISNGTASVSDITSADIEKVTQPSGEGSSTEEPQTTLTLDLSGAKQEVSSVELKPATVDILADTTSSSENCVDTVTIQMTNASVELDADALNNLSGEVTTEPLKVSVEETKQEKLSQNQQDALAGTDNLMIFSTNITTGSRDIHELGGTAKVSVRTKLTEQRNPNFVRVWYLTKDGGKERRITRCINDWTKYVTTTCSDYAVIYDETDQNETIPPLESVNLDKTKLVYDGKTQTVSIKAVAATAVDEKDTVVPQDAYTVTGLTAIDAGTYRVTVTAKEGAGYRGAAEVTYQIDKGVTSFKASAKKKTIKAKELKKKKQTTTVKVTGLSTGSSKPTYKLSKVTKGQKKKIKVNKKTGKVTLKKGTKKCTIKVKVTSPANKNRKALTKTVTIKVK
ncbi:Listeria/Bacterioides repeat-containing protein [Lachnospiraceae bacterium KHCPX20]|nr:Listeria/Bacterioides repeat-containing protein [Lachnospiraceae bacterium KHCPX20]